MTKFRLRSEKLREAAAAHGDATGYAISKTTGLAESTLSRLHRGKTRPSMGSLLTLATAYGLEVDDLIDRGETTEDNGDGAGARTPTPLAETHSSTL